MSTRFDIKRINMLKDILLRLNNGESLELIQEDVQNYFKDASIVDVLLIEHELLNDNVGITIDDLITLSNIYPHLYSSSLTEEVKLETSNLGHPVQIIKAENLAFQSILKQISFLFDSFEENPQRFEETEMLDVLRQQVMRLGEFHKHYHRKEKLLFPILERYGYFDSSRVMWRGDDHIRGLYQAVKKQIGLFYEIDFKLIRRTYNAFEKEFKRMIFQEEAIILPVFQFVFYEHDWSRISKETDAFGIALIKNSKSWINRSQKSKEEENIVDTNQNIPFGGGYLAIKEADLILNNLPLEITFVDKNSVFKYFNEITNASDMMLVRTPISIGRNVANCHPPKSLKKVMTIIRDLKAKKRTSESMWFKKKDEYIHITYKGLFNNQDEFQGILEYVQDIQPFFDLPTDVKRRLSKIDE